MNPDNKPTDHTSVSSLSYFSTLFLAIIALMLTLLVFACTSTVTDEPDETGDYSNEDIRITISGSDAYSFPSPRAPGLHDGHKLRFIASLYSTASGQPGIEAITSSGKPGNLVDRIEQSASDGNTVTFRGVDPGYYFVVVFADYIPVEATQNADGSYADKYYDTRTYHDHVALLASDADLFNNHNLDCFIYSPYDSFEKKAGKPLQLTFNMKRCVSRVDVVANSGSAAALKNISITRYSVLDNLKYLSANSSTIVEEASKQITLSPLSAGDSDNLLFFFYTFNASYGYPLKATDFTLNPNEGYTFSNNGVYSIPSGRITPEANFIYKVTGNFLSTTATPSKTVDINVTTLSDWSELPQDITEN